MNATSYLTTTKTIATTCFPILLLSCIAVIGLTMSLIYATTYNVVAIQNTEETAQELRKELTALASETQATTVTDGYEISHIVVIEPVAVSVLH